MKKAFFLTVVFTALCAMFAACGGDSDDSDPMQKLDVTVTFDAQDGDCSTKKHGYSSSFPCGWLPKAKSNRADYVFCGWNLLADGTGKTVTKNYVFKKNTTVYAQYESTDPYIKFNLYYDAVAAGITLTNEPSEIGYLLKGANEITIEMLPTYRETSTKDFIGYYLADGTTRVTDALGNLLPNIDGLTSPEGYWISNRGVDLYAYWKEKEYITSITMDYANYTMQVGQILEVTCTYAPVLATDDITWSCANTNIQFLTSECDNGVAKAKYALNGMSLSGSMITARSTRNGIVKTTSVVVNMGTETYEDAKMKSEESYDINDWNLAKVTNDCVVYQMDLVTGKKYQILWCDNESSNTSAKQMFTDAGKTLGDCYISVYDAQGNSNVFKDYGDFVFTAETTGRHYIILRSDYPSPMEKNCGFSIYPIAEISSLSVPSSYEATIGSVGTITAIYTPATSKDVVSWTSDLSSNTRIGAVVEQKSGVNGSASFKFNANQPSVFTVTATSKADDSIKKECNVTVKLPEDADITDLPVGTSESANIDDWIRIELPGGRAKVFKANVTEGEYYTIEYAAYDGRYSILGDEANYGKSYCHVSGYESRNSNTVKFDRYAEYDVNSSYTFKASKTGYFYFVVNKADSYTTDGLYAVHLFHERKISSITMVPASITKNVGERFDLTANFTDPLCNKGIVWNGYSYGGVQLATSTSGVVDNVGTGAATATFMAYRLVSNLHVYAVSGMDDNVIAYCNVTIIMPPDDDIETVNVGAGYSDDISEWTVVDMPGGDAKVYKVAVTSGSQYSIAVSGYGADSMLGLNDFNKGYCRIYQYNGREPNNYESYYDVHYTTDRIYSFSADRTGYYYFIVNKDTSRATDGKTAFYVYETVDPTGIAFDENPFKVGLNEDFTLTAKNIPENSDYEIKYEASLNSYEWNINNKYMYYKNNATSNLVNGVMTGKATFHSLIPGAYGIKAYSSYSNSVENTCTVVVEMPPEEEIDVIDVYDGPGSLPEWQIVQMPDGKTVVYKAYLTAGQPYTLEYAGYNTATSVLGPEASVYKSSCYVSGFATRDQAAAEWIGGNSPSNGTASFTPSATGYYYFAISRPYSWYTYDGLWAIHLYKDTKITSISLPATLTVKVGEDLNVTATFTDPASTVGVNWGENVYGYSSDTGHSLYRTSETSGVNSGVGTGTANAVYKTNYVGTQTITVSSNEDSSINAQCVVNVVLPDDDEIPDLPVHSAASSNLSDWQVVNLIGGRSKVYKANLTAGHTYRLQCSGYSSTGSILGPSAVYYCMVDAFSSRTQRAWTLGGVGSDYTYSFTPTTTGYYYFLVKYYYTSNTGNYVYAMHLYE